MASTSLLGGNLAVNTGRQPRIRRPEPRLPVRGWRLMAPDIYGFNMPAEFLTEGLLQALPMSTVELKDAFVSRREIIKSPAGEQVGEWVQRGAVYDSGRALLPEFEMASALFPGRFDHPPSVPERRVAEAECIKRPCIYLGTLHGHFGHFLVESLARSWALSGFNRKYAVAFHYANAPGSDNVGAILKILPSFVQTSFEHLDIDANRLILINQDLRFSELYIPRSQFWINNFGGSGMSSVYDDIRESMVRKYGSPVGPPRRLYLTRSQLRETQPHKVRKSVANELDVEELFVKEGFESVALERLSFPEQVLLLSNASYIAGPTGSALHMAMFNARPDAEVIAIDWRNSRTQYILEAARGLRGHHVYCFAGRDDRSAALVDANVVSEALADVLAPSGAKGGAKQVYATALQAKLARQQSQHDTSSNNAEIQKGSEHKAKLVASVARPTLLPSSPPRLFTQNERALFDTYLSVRPDRSNLALQSAPIWLLFDAIQRELGFIGDRLDIGAGGSCTALLSLILSRPGERVVCTNPERRPLLKPGLQILGPKVADRLLPAATWDELAQDTTLPASKVRWAHLDAHGDRQALTDTLERAASLVSDDGVLCVNNYFQYSMPEVTACVYHLLSDGALWQVLGAGFNKVYLAQSRVKRKYMEVLEREAKAFLLPFGEFVVDSVTFLDQPALTFKGQVTRRAPVSEAG